MWQDIVKLHTICQAGPLFTEAEKCFHREFAERLRVAGHEVRHPDA
jgi:hypothetical protein